MTAITGGIKKVNQGFRTSGAGLKLGRALFDPSTQLKLSPLMIASLLRQAGVPVPESVVIGTDVAQIIMSGGMVVSAVEAGGDIGSILVSSAQPVRAAMDILQITGLIDPKSPIAVTVRTGMDLAMAISSGGVDVLADIAVILDVVDIIGLLSHDYQADLNRAVQNDANAYMSARFRPESMAAAQLFQGYQNKSISVFQFIGGIADKAPDLFPSYFPQYGAFFPISHFTKTFTRRDSDGRVAMTERDFDTITGGVGFEPGTLDFYTSHRGSPEMQRQASLRRGLGKAFLEPLLEPYRMLDATTRGIRLKDLAVLSMSPPYFKRADKDFDIRKIMLSQRVSPADFGYVNEFAPKDILAWGKLPELNIKEDYRDVSKFWQLLSFAEYMKKDPFFSDYNGAIDQITMDTAGTVASLNDKHRALQFKTVGRRLNARAKFNIANYFGKPGSKIKMAPLAEGKLAYVI